MSWIGYKLVWVRVGLGMSWIGYELVSVRVDPKPRVSHQGCFRLLHQGSFGGERKYQMRIRNVCHPEAESTLVAHGDLVP